MNNNVQRWAVIVGALLLAAIVGVMAYNAGVMQGVEQSGKIVEGHWYGHRHGGFFFIPFLAIAFWFLIVRGLFWRGGWHRGACRDGGLDEWHRRAHERMWNEPKGAQPER